MDRADAAPPELSLHVVRDVHTAGTVTAEVIAPDRPSGTGDPRRGSVGSWRDGLGAAPVVVVLLLLILWAAHDGGYDEDTWYWGALILLALAAMVVGGLFGPLRRLGTATKVALGAFALYVAWSYASIAWAAK